MNRVQKRSGLAGLLLLGVLCATPLAAQNQAPAESITSEQAMACLRTAVASHPGRIKSLDVDVKGGKVLCEVEIAGENGRETELHIDVTTNQVVSSRPD
jgi:uncharacterized membrane protein YkoI